MIYCKLLQTSSLFIIMSLLIAHSPLESSCPDYYPDYYLDESNCFEDECNCLICDVCSSIVVRYTGGRAVGFSRGYLTLEGLFFPSPPSSSSVWPFIDIRAHRINDKEWAANAGIGVRYAPCYSKIFYGVNAYFDYRSANHNKFHYTQAGVGIEALGECWEFRSNVYIPIKAERTVQRCKFFYPGDFFIFRDRKEGAYTGFDVEIGHYFRRCCNFNFYLGAGPYYYGGKPCPTPLGGFARGSFTFCKWLIFGGGVSYDKVFNLQGNFFIGIQAPFGCNTCSQNMCEWRMGQPVYRNELIVLDEYCKWQFNY